MNIKPVIGDVLLRLQSDSSLLVQEWETIFRGWSDFSDEIINPGVVLTEVMLRFEISQRIAKPPDETPSYPQYPVNRHGTSDVLSVYWKDRSVLLRFPYGAEITIPISNENNHDRVILNGHITPQLLSEGYLLDVIITAISPLLRRHGYFLMHAFAVRNGDDVFLLPGPKGSGKTTTGYRLVSDGWGILADDVTLFTFDSETVVALPMPGAFNLSSHSVELLSPLTNIRDHVPVIGYDGKMPISVTKSVGKWASSSTITAICFPRIGKSPNSRLIPLRKAVTLARLLENSVDRWDESQFEKHVDILEALCLQAPAFDLEVGHDLENLPGLLTTIYHSR